MPSALPAVSNATERGESSQWAFAALALLSIVGATSVAGWAPLGFSIVTVFLFAGPHNWFEFRYFLSQMPARWGPLRGYFLTGIAGVLVFTASFALLPQFLEHFGADSSTWLSSYALLHTLMLLWAATLVWLRGRQKSRDWSWSFPAAFVLIAGVWAFPNAWDIGLVYLHPLVALFFLDREIARRRPEWQPAYRCCLFFVPVALALLYLRLGDAPDLPGSDALTSRITRHAGAGIIDGVSTQFLVAAHTSLEMLHYLVWVLAIPLISSTRPWRLQSVPLYRRSSAFRKLVIGIAACGALVVLVLWAGFATDYPLTRDLYFTLAFAHVLAEVPFALRTL